MLTLKFMHDFKEDPRYADSEDVVNNSSEQIELKFTNEQQKYISNLYDNSDFDCVHYLNPNMSLEMFEIIHQCTKLGDEYVQQLLSANLDDRTSEVVLYGYIKEINVIREAQEGESLENLRMLIDLLSQGFTNLAEIFDENMEYIDYEKVKEKLAVKN